MISGRGFTLGITCCFCGGRLNIDAASTNTRCDHCGSVLKILRADGHSTYIIRDRVRKAEIKFLIDHQLKQRGEPLVSRWESIARIYVPFWQVSGTVIHIRTRPAGSVVRQSDIKDRFHSGRPQVEVKIKPRQFSLCADNTCVWRIQSLGVRPQVIDLEPLDSETIMEQTFAPVTRSNDEAEALFLRSASSTGRMGAETGSASETMAVGLECMLLYFPIWVVHFSHSQGRFRGQFDPLARRLVSLEEEDGKDAPLSTVKPKIGQDLRLIPHRCPNCGCDLPVSGESVTSYCSRCHRMYLGTQEGYRQLPLTVAAGAERGDRLFPFWLFSLPEPSDPKDSDFARALRLVGFSTDQFYLPAFHISNPSKLMRLLAQYNRRVEIIRYDNPIDEEYDLVNVVVTQAEAAQLLVPLTIAAKARKGFKTSEAPISGELSLGKPELVWLPYTLDRYFWRDTVTGATIEKAAVSV